MKGANRLKLICHQGRSLVNIFSLWNIWYKSVVLSLIWLHSLVCQIYNKQMLQVVAYSGNICAWVVSCLCVCHPPVLTGQHSTSIKTLKGSVSAKITVHYSYYCCLLFCPTATATTTRMQGVWRCLWRGTRSPGGTTAAPSRCATWVPAGPSQLALGRRNTP